MTDPRQPAERGGAGGPWIDPTEARSNLTRGQFLIWVGQSLRPESPLYNMAFAYSIRGALDPERFCRAFAAEAATNDALRTVVDLEDGVPWQRVLSDAPAALEVVDLSGRPDPQDAARRFTEDRARRRLEPARALYDGALLVLADDAFVWFLNQHHLISDAWSSARLCDRVFQAYADPRVRGTPQGSFADYATRERRERGAARVESLREYWRRRLAADADVLHFYGRAPDASEPANIRVPLRLGPERSRDLRERARSMGLLSQDLAVFCSFATLLAAFCAWTAGARNIPIGVPLHQRSDRRSKQTPGLFAELLPLIVELRAEDSFRSLAQRIAGECLALLRHGAAGLSTPESSRRSEVVLNLLNRPLARIPGLELRTDWVHPGAADADHKLRLQVHDLDDEGAFTLLFDFNCGAFGGAERDLALSHFAGLLGAFLDDPDQPVLGVDLSTAEERAALRRFNDTAAPLPADSVIDLFRRQVDATPARIALSEGARDVDYATLARWTRALATELATHGATAGTLVPVVLGRSMEAVVALLAVLESGAAYLPLDPREPPSRLRSILDDAAASDFGPAPAVLADPEIAQALGSRFDCLTVDLERLAGSRPAVPARRSAGDAAYVIYTSGSTGRPKGVVIEDGAVANYLAWARSHYADGPLDMALHSSLAVDLTVTSLFLPLITGGRVRIAPYTLEAGDVPILDVFRADDVDAVKLTPAHLDLLGEAPGRATRIRTLILGGEDLKAAAVRAVLDRFPDDVRFFNEYGPTEATVGCMIHRFDPAHDRWTSVPIGRPIANTRIHLLGPTGHPVPRGIVGEICVAGAGLARGYLNSPAATADAFVEGASPGERIYRTGDLGRNTLDGRLEFLGRADRQTKVRGVRVELGEVEAVLGEHPGVDRCVVEPVAYRGRRTLQHCARCGIPSNHPDVQFDAAGVCSLCSAFEEQRELARLYFKDKDQFRALAEAIRSERRGDHDCVVLFSGGKDSTYMLYQLVALGLRPLTFTLDNGFISEGAKQNIRRAVEHLGVEHVFGGTPHMNAIFADSLARYSNVCNGCFKTIYTLSVNLARERGIRYVITGLSRGQIFETRLHDLFRQRVFDVPTIERRIADARKIYHRVDDAVSRNLDVSAFADDRVFDQVRFVDFYRYWDVGLDEVYAFLDGRAPWVRPADTGRSTNCLINDAGIAVHKQERGYHNYALPYSWDVRIGHKTRDAALDELNDSIDGERVAAILRQVGYIPKSGPAETVGVRLVAYYVGAEQAAAELRAFLEARLPAELIPTDFVHLDALPLTPAGKLDRRRLPDPERGGGRREFVAPRNDVEARLAEIWQEVLDVDRVGVSDNFFELGGHSLPALQVIARVADCFDVALPIRTFFSTPTIGDVAAAIEDLLIDQIERLSDDEVEGFISGD